MRSFRCMMVIMLICTLSACGRIQVKSAETRPSAEKVAFPLAETTQTPSPAPTFEISAPISTQDPAKSVYAVLLEDTSITEIGLTDSYNDKEQELCRSICRDLEGTWLNESFINNIKSRSRSIYDNCDSPPAISFSYDDYYGTYCWNEYWLNGGVPGWIERMIIERNSTGLTLKINKNDDYLSVVITQDGIAYVNKMGVIFHKIDCSLDEFINRTFFADHIRIKMGIFTHLPRIVPLYGRTEPLGTVSGCVCFRIRIC